MYFRFFKRYYSNINFNSEFINSHRRSILGWLLLSSGSVMFMISLGGYTRLTKSGLSMTDWRPLTKKYPKDLEEWNKEFDNYKKFPEFKELNYNINLEGFKGIYFWEYFHRLWGNIIGYIFFFPLVYFNIRKAIKPKLNKRLFSLFLMGGFQGLVGWWMVKSGLEKKKEYHNAPKVSTYRLTFHLTNAFIIYSGLIYTYFNILHENMKINQTNLKFSKKWGMILIHIFAFNLLTGAQTAGIEAGRVFNTWPLMNGKIIPHNYWIENWGLKNIFENLGNVQFNHRLFAYITYTLVTVMFFKSKKLNLSNNLKLAINSSFILVNIQLLLGIYIILYQVPINFGSLHQTNSVLFLSTLLFILSVGRRKGKIII